MRKSKKQTKKTSKKDLTPESKPDKLDELTNPVTEEEMSDLKVVTWKQFDSQYVLQAENVERRHEKRLVQDLVGWNLTGNGAAGDGKLVLLFQKRFQNRKALIAWSKTFPHTVQELSDRTGLLTPLNASKAKATPKKVQAPKKKAKAKASTTRNPFFGAGNKQKTCSACGGKGHNKRTCPSS